MGIKTYNYVFLCLCAGGVGWHGPSSPFKQRQKDKEERRTGLRKDKGGLGDVTRTMSSWQQWILWNLKTLKTEKKVWNTRWLKYPNPRNQSSASVKTGVASNCKWPHVSAGCWGGDRWVALRGKWHSEASYCSATTLPLSPQQDDGRSLQSLKTPCLCCN